MDLTVRAQTDSNPNGFGCVSLNGYAHETTNHGMAICVVLIVMVGYCGNYGLNFNVLTIHQISIL